MIGPTDLFHPSPAPHFKTFLVFLIYCPKFIATYFIAVRFKEMLVSAS
jgi:hypothetical protein